MLFLALGLKNNQDPILQTAHRQAKEECAVDETWPTDSSVHWTVIHRLPPQLRVDTLTHRQSTGYSPVTFSFLILYFFFLTLHCFHNLLPIVSKLGMACRNKCWNRRLDVYAWIVLVPFFFVTNTVGEKEEWGWAGRHAHVPLVMIKGSKEMPTNRGRAALWGPSRWHLRVITSSAGWYSSQSSWR